MVTAAVADVLKHFVVTVWNQTHGAIGNVGVVDGDPHADTGGAVFGLGFGESRRCLGANRCQRRYGPASEKFGRVGDKLVHPIFVRVPQPLVVQTVICGRVRFWEKAGRFVG